MSARLSPGGALLRTSRMFSLPKPIPASTHDTANGNSAGVATHPTHQSITTFEANRKKGDWGLKRSLPLRTTIKTSTPAVRIRKMDSCEMVTDFAPSSEHTITVKKFQELNLPLTMPPLPTSFRSASAQNVSVFEEDSDFTAAESAEPGSVDASKRWRFKGPWLAGMSEGEFDEYLRKTVRPRRAQFRAFMKKRLAADMTAANQKAALDNAETPVSVSVEDITDAQFSDYVRKLRNERIALFSMISDFLDLAPVSPPSALSSMSSGTAVQTKSPNPYAESGPPVTHPSAGLSYLRTASFAENHPVYGPQSNAAPALGRILKPRMGQFSAKVGIGGFVANAPQGDSAWNMRMRSPGQSKARIPGLTAFDPSIPGGPKAYVKARNATVQYDGKVLIRLDDASEMAQLITKELIGEAEIYNKPPVVTAPAPESAATARLSPRAPLGSSMRSSSRAYGLDA